MKHNFLISVTVAPYMPSSFSSNMMMLAPPIFNVLNLEIDDKKIKAGETLTAAITSGVRHAVQEFCTSLSHRHAFFPLSVTITKV